MKFLITGGAGFIGSHLAERLISRPAEIHILDNLSTGNVANLEQIKNSGLLFINKGSTLDDKILEKNIRESDAVFHLAASVGVKLVIQEPLLSIQNNLEGTEKILWYASRHSKKVLLASTSEVYGKSSKKQFSENDDLIMGPPSITRWNYAATKLMDEHLALAYHKQKGLRITIARLFNTVGERQSSRYGMVLPRFIDQAIRGDNLTIYGNGKQTRCFCYVGDAVWALEKLMENQKSDGEIYNIGSQEEISINNLANRVIQITNSLSKKTYIEYTKIYGGDFDEPPRRKPNIQKITNLIGFKPRYNINQIIKKIYDEKRHSKKLSDLLQKKR